MYRSYWRTLWRWALIERQANSFAASRQSPSITWNTKLITAFTITLQLFISCASPTQSTPPHTISPRFILILYNHIRLGLSGGLFPFGPPTKNLYSFLFFHSCYMPRPFHLPWFDHSNYTWRRVQIIMHFSSLSCHFSLLSLNAFISTLFSSTLSLCSSLKIRDQVSHPNRTTRKIIVLHILIL
jgi:hypothetical protein